MKQLSAQFIPGNNRIQYLHLVRFDESDKNWEEHGRRSRFGVLSKILHGRVVHILEHRKKIKLHFSSWNEGRLTRIVSFDLGQSKLTCAVLPSATRESSSSAFRLRNVCRTGFSCSSENSVPVASMPLSRARTSCRMMSRDTTRPRGDKRRRCESFWRRVEASI